MADSSGRLDGLADRPRLPPPPLLGIPATRLNQHATKHIQTHIHSPPPCGSAEAEEPAAEGRQDEDSDSEMGPPTEEPEEEDGAAFSFKYSPGQLRGSQYKKMMTKEELEEEHRVQKEQLAAIFKLMKDNKDTFGEMSDGDMQEQLRLYDM